MTILQTIRTRRALAGGIALAAGTAAIAAPAVVPPLAANPLDDANVSPSVNGVGGTYESCSAMFGLTDKTTANYVTFSVGGTATPLPGIGAGLTPVLTIDIGGTVEECTPEIGFNDQSSWATYLGLPTEVPEVAVIVPYGGSPGYLIPNFAAVPGGAAGEPSPAIPAPLLSLGFVQADATLTVTSSPTSLVYTPPPTNMEEGLDVIVEELGGPTSPLGARFAGIYGGATCDNNAAIDQELGIAMVALTGIPLSTFDGLESTPCGRVFAGSEARLLQLPVDALGLAVSVTVSAPAPAPAPTPAPSPEPVTPQYTG